MTPSLAGKRVLIVEDEYFIASDLERTLAALDADVVGPVGSLAEGLALIEREQIDAAVLDVNLDGTASYPIADKLAATSVPHLFLTGYNDWALPDPYRATPHLGKPYNTAALVDLLQQFCIHEETG